MFPSARTDQWPGGPEHQSRLRVGMQRVPADELRQCLSLVRADKPMDSQTAIRLKRKLAEEFRNQLAMGAPNDADEVGLRRLAAQLKSGKLITKLFLRHPLHAKLYLCFRSDFNNPRVVIVSGGGNVDENRRFENPAMLTVKKQTTGSGSCRRCD